MRHQYSAGRMRRRKQEGQGWFMFKTHFLASAGLGNGNRDTKDGVGTEITLVRCTVKLDEEVINILLLGDFEAGRDKLRGDNLVDVCNSLRNT